MHRCRISELTLFLTVGAAVYAVGGCNSSGSTAANGAPLGVDIGTGAVGVQSLLFIKRQTKTIVTNADGTTTLTYDVDSGNGQVLDYQRYVPGGSLNLLSTADGTVANLTPSFTTADFNGADVSFDATQAVESSGAFLAPTPIRRPRKAARSTLSAGHPRSGRVAGLIALAAPRGIIRSAK